MNVSRGDLFGELPEIAGAASNLERHSRSAGEVHTSVKVFVYRAARWLTPPGSPLGKYSLAEHAAQITFNLR